MGVSQNYLYPFGGPHNKDYSVWGSILGVPLFWETTMLRSRLRAWGFGFAV